ncbi:MAG: PQQ-like beta-propeller repeat protein [Bryobacterales bacterium]|nr:PQQ-like beta-propeller repeat protein [Bryobacterales bacterium]
MTMGSRVLRACLYGAAALVAVALCGTAYIRWSGASVGLSGSGRGIVIEHANSERRMQDLEESRRAQERAQAHPARQDLERSAVAAKPAPAVEQPTGPANYWTEYRGPGRAGIYGETKIRTDWPAEGPPELWRQQIGGGYASMVVADSLVFTIEQRRGREVVAAYRIEDGSQAWEHSWRARFSESMGGDGPRATPTWSDGRLYALGASGHLTCLQASDGRVLWERNILADAGADNLTWGMAGAPLVVDDIVVTLPGGRRGRSIIAYDKLSGDVRWSALNDKAGYVSPQVAELAGRRQLLVISGTRVLGASLDDGSLLWSHPWRTSYDANCAQPLVVDGEHVFVSSGYGHGAALLKITADGEAFSVEEVWFNRNMKNKFNPSVLASGVVYGLDEGIMVALDVRTGERHWKQGRYRYGQLLHAGGHLIVVSEQGDLALVEATPEEYRELARFEAIPGKTWNVPAMADGILYVRNQTEMAAYDLR